MWNFQGLSGKQFPKGMASGGDTVGGIHRDFCIERKRMEGRWNGGIFCQTEVCAQRAPW